MLGTGLRPEGGFGFGGFQHSRQFFRGYSDYLTILTADHRHSSLNVAFHGLQSTQADGFQDGRTLFDQGVNIDFFLIGHEHTPS